MIPGIDPKIDIAFKKVFGSEPWTDLTASLINAVLEPPPQQRLVDVELLNPYSEKMTLDDKLAILDIKGRDQQGSLYNLEMQMLLTAALAQRLLYYWAKVYSQQLSEGDDYTRLRPTISICFVNGEMFPGHPEYHTEFRLRDPTGRLSLTGDMSIHVIELPKFRKTLAELQTPLDFWLYFLKNGGGLDADALPEALDRAELRKAMGVLKMLAQNDVERELYEGRLKVKRDMQTLETMRRTAEAQTHTLEAQRDQWQQRYEAANREREAANREREAANREREAANREREAANRELKRELVERIGLCQRLLRRPVSGSDKLIELSAEELRDQAERLERELTQGIGPT
jgi:predicted transposase/invertase (TIGR01784 family)